MAHAVTMRQGRTHAVYGSGTPPWHHAETQAKIFAGLLSDEEILREVEPCIWTEKQAFFLNRMGEYQPAGRFYLSVAEWRDGRDDAVGQCTEQRKNYQFSDFFLSAKPVVEKFGAVWDAGGVLSGGSEFWLCAKLPEDWTAIHGDTYQKYLTFSAAATGAKAYRVWPAVVRAICKNTVDYSEMSASSIIRKTASGDVDAKVLEVADQIEQAIHEFEAGHRTILEMLDVELKPIETANFVLQALGIDLPEIKKGHKDWSSKAVNLMNRITRVLTHGKGAVGTPEQSGTLKFAFDTVTEFVDHHRTVRKTTGNPDADTVVSNILGSGRDVKRNALTVARNIIGADGKVEQVMEVVEFTDSNVNLQADNLSDLLQRPVNY